MSSPVPILFTIPNFITAGSGRAMLNIIERLDRAEFAPSICVSKKGGDLEREIERQGIPLLEHPFTVPAKPYRTLPARARAAAAAFRPHRFALWHSFHYSDDYTEPIIARFSGSRHWVYTKKNMNWGKRAWYVRSLLASRIAVQNSDMMMDFFSGPLLKRKSRMVPRGVITERFCPGVSPRLGLRESCGIPGDAIVAGCVSHLVPVKGHPTLIEALARVPGVHLMVAGKPLDREYSDSLIEQAMSLGLRDRVHFVGDVRDVPGFLAEMDIFAFPTRVRGEGCPVALLEAMSCGCACISTDVPGSRDLVQPGQSGLIVPSEDPAALAEAMGRLAADPALRRDLGEKARERVARHFSIDAEVAAHEALYRELLGRGRVAGGTGLATAPGTSSGVHS